MSAKKANFYTINKLKVVRAAKFDNSKAARCCFIINDKQKF